MTTETTNNAPVDSFDFFLSLEDVDGFSKETQAMLKAEAEQYKAEREASKAEQAEWSLDEPEETDDTYNFWEDEDIKAQLEKADPFADEEEDEESDDVEDNSGEEEEADENISTDEEEYSDESDEDYDYSVDEDTTLNLPDGRIMSIGELQQKALDDDAFKAREEAFNERVSNFEAQYEAAKETIEIAELEVDKVIESYNSWDWDDLYYNDPQTFATEKRYFDKMVQRKQHLIQEQAKNKLRMQEAKDAEFKAQSASCVAVLKQAIPNWNDNLYEKLMNYAVSEWNEDPEEVLKWNKPNDFLRLYKLYQYDKGIDKAKATLKGGKKGGKFLSSGGARAKASKEAQQAKAAHMLATGKMTTRDAFAFLED